MLIFKNPSTKIKQINTDYKLRKNATRYHVKIYANIYQNILKHDQFLCS